jgi:hypothetical protein
MYLKIKLMKLNKDFITENSKKLLESILLSIKSSEGTRLTENCDKEGKNRSFHYIETNEIRTKRLEGSIISGFSISINRFEEHKWFSPNVYNYELSLNTLNDRGYSNNKYESLINSNQDLIEKIYNFLIDLERNKKIEEQNQTLEKIIGDISTTIEKKYRRDETINEILN